MKPTRMLVVLVPVLAALLAACDETTRPPAPPKPPQIKTLASYTKRTNDRGVPNGLPSNDVFAFLTLTNGEFWVGTKLGIARFANVTATTRGPDDTVNEVTGLPNPEVRAMAEHNGKVYVATWGGGFGIYDIAGDTWTQVRVTRTGLLNGYIADVQPSPTEDRVYFATNDGVYIYNPTAGTFTTFFSPLPQAPLTAFIVSSLEIVENLGVVERWFGPRIDMKLLVDEIPNHGITVWKSASTVYTYAPTNSGLAEPNVNDIYYDPVGGLWWVAYATTGIASVNVTDRIWTNYTLVQGLPSNTVYSITRAGGTLWAGTQGGLAKLVNGTWTGYTRANGLQADRVRRVYSDDGERLWVGFVDGGAARVEI